MMQPIRQKNDIADRFVSKGANLQVQGARFKTRLRMSQTQVRRPLNSNVLPRLIDFFLQHLEIKVQSGGKTKTFAGTVAGVNGRKTDLKSRETMHPMAKIKSIYTVGRDDPTSAETACSALILKCLRGESKLASSPFISTIWFSSLVTDWSPSSFPTCKIVHPPERKLNNSQMNAVNAILSQVPITIIQGPPGSGKTTVAASTVMSIIRSSPKRTVYLVAQSNVAVKNIAEKLADIDFWDFRLLVSKDFHFDWLVIPSRNGGCDIDLYKLGMSICMRRLRGTLSAEIQWLTLRIWLRGNCLARE